jgi:hypothetical protein
MHENAKTMVDEMLWYYPLMPQKYKDATREILDHLEDYRSVVKYASTNEQRAKLSSINSQNLRTELKDAECSLNKQRNLNDMLAKDVTTQKEETERIRKYYRSELEREKVAKGDKQEGDHHASDRDRDVKTAEQTKAYVNTFRPCCIPIGDACELLARISVLETSNEEISQSRDSLQFRYSALSAGKAVAEEREADRVAEITKKVEILIEKQGVAMGAAKDRINMLEEALASGHRDTLKHKERGRRLRAAMGALREIGDITYDLTPWEEEE